LLMVVAIRASEVTHLKVSQTFDSDRMLNPC